MKLLIAVKSLETVFSYILLYIKNCKTGFCAKQKKRRDDVFLLIQYNYRQANTSVLAGLEVILNL